MESRLDRLPHYPEMCGGVGIGSYCEEREIYDRRERKRERKRGTRFGNEDFDRVERRWIPDCF